MATSFLKSKSLFKFELAALVVVLAVLGSVYVFNSRAAGITGDINNDGVVNITDLSLLLSSYGASTSVCITNSQYTCDLNSDGVVNVFDLSILLSNYGRSGQVTYSCTNPGPFRASVDTMKESMDTDANQLTPTQIANDVNLSATLHVTHITVDVHWDYPSYMQAWVDAVRATGKHVWFRIHPNAWEGDYGVPATMTPSQYLTAETSFIAAHPTLFQSGDILDMNPEPENSPYWINTYGSNWTSNKTGADAFNQFYMDVSDTATAALQQAGITGVITTIRSTNSWFAQTPSALYPSTVAHMGYVTFDSYPDQNTTSPTTAVQNRLAEMSAIEQARPNVPLIDAEFGYSNAINVDDTTQSNVISAELNAISGDSCIQGLNYWVGAGTQNSGGYTHIFAGSTGNWSLRPAANNLSSYFAQKTGQ